MPYNMLVVVCKSCHELNYNKQKNDVASFNKASVLQYVCMYWSADIKRHSSIE